MWEYCVFRQIQLGKSPPWCAIAHKKTGKKKIYAVNAEGRTRARALREIRKRVETIELTGSPW